MTEVSNDTAVKAGGGNKKVAIEKIYQKKTQLEHILLRPDTYVGSVERVESEMWIWDFDTEKMIKKNIKYVPGLFKIFDEILVNSADNKIRDPNMNVIKININKEQNMIKIYNNGKGIPVVEHKDEKVYVPTLIFGHLLTSSNYDDDEKKVTGGRNGYGAKLCNIFSKKFIVETSCKESKKYFKQTWEGNMGKTQEPTIKPNKDEDFTSVTFYPDLKKFGMDELEEDTIALLARRAYDIAASTRGVKVYLNDKKLPISKFEDYCKLYVANNENENDLLNMNGKNDAKIIYEKPNDRWEIAVSYSDIGFQQVSFVNSIATTKGGRHVDYIADQIVKHLTEVINKKSGKNSTQVKPFQIKNHLWLFVNCLIENPVFESQTKESMSLQVKNFGSKCHLSDSFQGKIASKSGIVDRVMNWLAFKEKTDLEKGGAKSKVSKVKGIPKLDDANNAGTKDSINCTLILTEGDSAKTLAVAGLGVLGRDRYGVFPLKGKMLNVREATTKQILDNAEITSLCKIIGLNFKERYQTKDSMKMLRYGKIMIMTDQDHDGSHIKGLIINFIHHQWPNLLKFGFLEEFITPIIKVFKSKKSASGDGDQEKSFYSMPEFEEWQKANPDTWHTWKIKYYKGLGTSTSKEAKEYFSNMNRHCIQFEYSGCRDDLSIQLAFSKRFIEERKDWLTKFMERRVREINENENSNYLYQKDTKKINFTEFVNKELVLFSNLDNERSIPSLVDGFKPGQRKVLFACFKRNLQKEIKVAQLAGSVGELSAYHHGEQSLMGTIINLAQNFVGSNNLNLLLPIGQFGTRLHGGKDAASPRYIFTNLNSLTRLLFNAKDDPLYDYINDDGQRVEPEFYCPILPTVLVNGAEGIGTGWAVKIPNYNVKDLVNNLKRLINREEPFAMKPYYKNFKGTIHYLDESRFVVNGEVALIEDENDSKNDYTVEISELPIGTWTQVYKESVLESFLHGPETKSNDASKFEPLINDYKEYHTDCTVRFLVKMSKKQYTTAMEQGGLHKFFKLQKTISLNNMVLFDSKGCLKRYESPIEILKEFYQVRLKYYAKRKEYLENMLGAESCKLDNIARFILEKIEGKIKIENLKKNDLIKLLAEKGYQSDPIRKWKEKITQEKGYLHDAAGLGGSNDQEQIAEDSDVVKTLDFNYLLSMPLLNLTWEKKEEILKQQRQKLDELKDIQNKTVEQLWLDDLTLFKEEYDKAELKEKEEFEMSFVKNIEKASGASGKKKTSLGAQLKFEYLPSPDGERIEPKIDAQTIAKVEKEAQQKVLNKVKKDESLKGLNIVDIITSNDKLVDPELIQQINDLTSGNVNKQKTKSVAGTNKQAKATGSSENGEPLEYNDDPLNELSIIDIIDNEKKTKKTTPSKKGGGDKKPITNGTSNGGKKKPEKITVDSDSEKSFDDAEFSKLDDEFTSVRHLSSGRAKKPVKYNVDLDNSESELEETFEKSNIENSDHSLGDDFVNEKPKKELKANAKVTKDKEKKPKITKNNFDFGGSDNSSDNEHDDEASGSDFELSNTKKKSNKKLNNDPDSSNVTKKKTAPKKEPKAKPPKKEASIEADSDTEKSVKKAPAKKKAQPPKKETKPKEATKKTAKKKKIYNSESDGDMDDSFNDDDNDSDFDVGSAKKAKKAPTTKPKAGSKKATAAPKRKATGSESDSSEKSIKKTKPMLVNDEDDFSLDE